MSYDEDVAHVRLTLEAATKLPTPARFTLHGKSWRLNNGVFPTTITSGTDVFAWGLRETFVGDFCEMGCGAGVISVLAALGGADVVAVDINGDALQNTLDNAEIHGVQHKVRTIESDLFSSLAPHYKFDTIFWNVPWGFLRHGEPLSGSFEQAVFDPGYEMQEKYLYTGSSYLKDGGRLLIGTTDIGDIDLLESRAVACGKQLKMRFEELRAEVQGLTRYMILEAIDA